MRIFVVGLLPSQAHHVRQRYPDVVGIEIDKALRLRHRASGYIIIMSKFSSHNVYETLQPDAICTGGLSSLFKILARIMNRKSNESH